MQKISFAVTTDKNRTAIRCSLPQEILCCANTGTVLILLISTVPVFLRKVFWSEWGDSNSQHPAPKAGALPVALHPVILLFSFPLSSVFLPALSALVTTCRPRSFLCPPTPSFPCYDLASSATGGASAIAPKLARCQLRYTRLSLLTTINKGRSYEPPLTISDFSLTCKRKSVGNSRFQRCRTICLLPAHT